MLTEILTISLSLLLSGCMTRKTSTERYRLHGPSKEVRMAKKAVNAVETERNNKGINKSESWNIYNKEMKKKRRKVRSFERWEKKV
jgi:hypothetical protein